MSAEDVKSLIDCAGSWVIGIILAWFIAKLIYWHFRGDE